MWKKVKKGRGVFKERVTLPCKDKKGFVDGPWWKMHGCER